MKKLSVIAVALCLAGFLTVAQAQAAAKYVMSSPTRSPRTIPGAAAPRR